MTEIYLLGLAAVIGIVAGLRSMTAPAVVSWAGYLGWLNLADSPVSFMDSIGVVVLFSIFAVAEYVADKLPQTPSRTKAGSLVVRTLMGALAGTCLIAPSDAPLMAGAGLGGIGAVIGTFTGYEVRRKLVRDLTTKDLYVALVEDLVAIGLAVLVVAGSS